MSERVADLERRISNERRQLDRTLEELEHRLSPRRLMHQAIDYLKHSGASLLGGWGRAMKRNPFPLALTAAGLTMVPALRRHSVPLALTTVGLTLMARSAMGERDAPETRREGRWDGWQGEGYEFGDQRHHGHGDSLMHRARNVAHDLKQQVDETADAFAERVAHAQGEVLGLARRAGETAGEFATRVSRALSDGADSIRDTLRHTAEAAGDLAGRVSTAVGQGAQSVRDGVAHTAERAGELAGRVSTAVGQGAHSAAHTVKESVMHSADHARDLAQRGREQAGTFLREQPLLAIAIGVGFGALLGALLPTTPVERRNLGPMADRALGDVKQKARVLGDTAERVAGSAVEAATTGAERAVKRWEGQDGGNGNPQRH